MNFGWGLAAQHLDQPPERHDRPRALEQQESPLLLMPGEHGEHGRSDEIENVVEARVLVEEAELSRAVRHQDEQRAEDLYDLSHTASVAQSFASGHTQA